jgi:hypothetical protein
LKREHESANARQKAAAFQRAVTSVVTGETEFGGGQAGAAAGTCSSLGKGLKVKAIRKAPIPIAHEPTYSHV